MRYWNYPPPSFAVALEPGPQQLVGGDRRDELDPAVGWRVGQRPAAGDLVAGGYDHSAAVDVPCRRSRGAPPFEEGVRHLQDVSMATPMR
jgi:hypothetical protein